LHIPWDDPLFGYRKHPGGYAFISLAAITDPKDTPRTVAHALYKDKFLGEPTAERIAASLPETPTLLIIDNLEHVIQSKHFFFALLSSTLYIFCKDGGCQLPIVNISAALSSRLRVIRSAGCFSASDFFNIRLVQVTLRKDSWSIVFLFRWLPKALEKLFSTEERPRALVGQRKICTKSS